MCNEDETSDYLLRHCMQVLLFVFSLFSVKWMSRSSITGFLASYGGSSILWGGVGVLYLDSCSIMCMLDHMEGGRYENLQ